MNHSLTVDEQDASTVLEYKTSLERSRGYNGQCFISMSRLTEIHMLNAYLVTKLALMKASKTQL